MRFTVTSIDPALLVRSSMGNHSRPILHTTTSNAQRLDNLSHPVMRMPTKDHVRIRVRQLYFHLIQLRTRPASTLPTMHRVDNCDGLRPTRTRVPVPLNTDEPAIPKVLRLDTKQRTDLVTNLAISVLTDRALVITRKPSPNLIFKI